MRRTIRPKRLRVIHVSSVSTRFDQVVCAAFRGDIYYCCTTVLPRCAPSTMIVSLKVNYTKLVMARVLPKKKTLFGKIQNYIIKSIIPKTVCKFSCVCMYQRAIKNPRFHSKRSIFLARSENRFIDCDVAMEDRKRFRVKTMT